MKVIFFGSSDYCIPILETLYKTFDLIAIITKPDHSVESYTRSHNIEVFVPKDTQELLSLNEKITKRNPDLAIVADYGLIIPREIFSIPRFKTLNIHFSKLPKFRGPSPVQYTILTGEKSAWVSIIIMDESMDTGDIIWQKEVKLSGSETTGHLYQKLFNIAALDLPEVLNKYVKNELKPRKQNNSLATYTKHFSRTDGFIPFQILAAAVNWKNKILPETEIKNWPLSNILDTRYLILNTSIAIERAIRAFSPWPGLWTEVTVKQSTNNPINTNQPIKKRLKILKAHLEPPKPYTLNTIPFLVPDLVQLEGKKPVTWKQFMEGYLNFSF